MPNANTVALITFYTYQTLYSTAPNPQVTLNAFPTHSKQDICMTVLDIRILSINLQQSKNLSFYSS